MATQLPWHLQAGKFKFEMKYVPSFCPFSFENFRPILNLLKMTVKNYNWHSPVQPVLMVRLKNVEKI